MKKLVALVVAVMLALVAFAACAETATPSKTTSDLASIEEVKSSTGAEIAADFVAAIVEEDSEAVADEVTAIFEATQDKAPIEYFPEDVQDAVKEALPEGVDAEDLEMNEILPIVIENYDEAYGDLELTFTFDTEYTPDQTLVALVGTHVAADDTEDGAVWNWTVLEAAANEDGSVTITFTEEALKAIEEADDTLLAILSK